MSGRIGSPDRIGKSVEWYTPRWIFDALALEFDLDPASPHDFDTQVPARVKYTRFDDGLKKPWFGAVWLNPPYNKDTPFWMRRLIDHGDGLALVFSRTDARWFQECLNACSACLLFQGRIEFIPGHENAHKAAKSGAGSALFAFGDRCRAAILNLRDRGFLIDKAVTG
jgi:hypothetical protein